MLIQKISALNLYNTQFTAQKQRKTVPNLSQPHIDRCEFGILHQDTQDTLQNIQDNYSKIKDYFDNLKTSPLKARKIRERYESLIRRNNKQGLTFKNPETDELVTVLQSRNKSNNLLRFIIEGKESSTHLLVETPNRVIKNIDPNAPYVIPPKFRYMTDTEIQASGLPKYAEFINAEVEKYHQYLQNYDELFPRQKSGPKVGYKRKPKQEPNIEKTYTTDDVSKLFAQGTKFPPHVTPTISPRSGQILGLNLTTSNGNTLKIYKSMIKDVTPPFLYISFIETAKDGSKKYLNIASDSKEFLPSSIAGKPLIDDEGYLQVYTEEEAEERGILDKFNEYMNEIFAQNTESRAKVEAPTLIYKPKKAAKRKPRIEDIRIEDIEDKNLNKLLDKNKDSILD